MPKSRLSAVLSVLLVFLQRRGAGGVRLPALFPDCRAVGEGRKSAAQAESEELRKKYVADLQLR